MIYFKDEKAREDYKKWLSELKPGDVVAMYGGSWGGYSILRISRTTPTTFVINIFASHIKIDRKTGCGKGGEMRWRQIEPVTHQIICTIKRKKLAEKLYRLDTTEFSLDTLQRINHLVQKEQKRIKAAKSD